MPFSKFYLKDDGSEYKLAVTETEESEMDTDKEDVPIAVNVSLLISVFLFNFPFRNTTDLYNSGAGRSINSFTIKINIGNPSVK